MRTRILAVVVAAAACSASQSARAVELEAASPLLTDMIRLVNVNNRLIDRISFSGRAYARVLRTQNAAYESLVWDVFENLNDDEAVFGIATEMRQIGYDMRDDAFELYYASPQDRAIALDIWFTSQSMMLRANSLRALAQ